MSVRNLVLGLAASLTLATSPALATNDPYAAIAAMKELNVITASTLNSSSQHVQGKVWVGGSLTGNIEVTQGGGTSTTGTRNALTVAGNAADWAVSNGLSGSSGNVQIGGNSTGQAKMNASGSVQVGGTFNASGYNNPYSANVSGLQASLNTQTVSMVSDLKSLSTYLAGLSGTAIANFNSALSISSGTPYAVFTMTQAVFNTQNANFSNLFSNVGANTVVVINVSGTSLVMDGGANLNSFANYQNVIWNFTDAASSVTLRNWYGNVLAINSTVNQSAGNITGTVVANVFNQTGEVHLSTFQGNTTALLAGVPQSPVPEAATWVMMIIGFGAVGAGLRSQRRGRRAIAID